MPPDRSASTRRLPATRQVNFRLPWTTWQRLSAAAGALGQTQSALVATALAVYFESLPASRRKLIDDALAARLKP